MSKYWDKNSRKDEGKWIRVEEKSVLDLLVTFLDLPLRTVNIL